MEKIKNLLGRGSNDDELYNTGNTTNTGNTGSLSGEGSHLSSNTGTTGTNSGYDGQTAHSSSLGSKVDPRIDSSNTNTSGGLTGSNTGYGNTTTSNANTSGGLTGSNTGYGNTTSNTNTSGGLTGSNTGYGNTSTSNTTGTGIGSQQAQTSSFAKEVDSSFNPSNTSTTTSGLGSGSNTYGTTSSTTGQHTGRDAALAGGAGAAALEGEHLHRQHEGSATTTSGYGSTGAYGNTSSTNTTGQPIHSSNLLNKADPRVDSNTTTSGSNYTGTTGSGVGSSYSGEPVGSAVPGMSGVHHNTVTADRLDPAINSGSPAIEDASEHHPITGGGGTSADLAHGGSGPRAGRVIGSGSGVGAGAGLAHRSWEGKHDKDLTEAERKEKKEEKHELKEERKHHHGHESTTTGTHGHHVARDGAAVGAAGLVGEHEHHKHEQQSSGLTGSGAGFNTASGTNSGYTSSGVGGNGPAPNTSGPHSKDWMNKLDPKVDANPDTPVTGYTGSQATTIGSDAPRPMANRSAYVDPVARDNPGFTESNQGGYSTGGTGTTGHHLGRDAAIGGAGATGVYEADMIRKSRDGAGLSSTTGSGFAGSNLGGTTGLASHTTTTGASDHHVGRDAAVAGGVGTAGYEAEKHHEKHQEKHHEKHQEKKSGGFLSFLHRDKSKKYTAEEEADFDRQEREHHSHAGRDVAGAGAVGAAGYEAEKHHHHSNTDKALPVAPGNHGVGTGAGTQNALESNTGNTGSTSAWEGDHPPAGTTLGDKLHGTDRNRGVSDDAYAGSGSHNLLHKQAPDSHPASSIDNGAHTTRDAYGTTNTGVGPKSGLTSDGANTGYGYDSATGANTTETNNPPNY